MEKSDFALFWAKAPAPADWENLALSGVGTLMLAYKLARGPALLEELDRRGVSVVLALEQDNNEPAPTVAANVARASALARVRALVVGREPDAPYLLHDRSPGWGLEAAFRHRQRFDALRRSLSALPSPVPVLSPGLALRVRLPNGTVGRSISEDDTPAPGVTSWREICAAPDRRGEFGWNHPAVAGNCWHLYLYGWSGETDRERVKMELRRACELLHRPIWLDEVGVLLPTNVQQMQAYIEIFELIRSHQSGYRVQLFCPFISTGYPDGSWPAGYLLQDPAAYRLLGEWMRAGEARQNTPNPS